MFLFCFEFLSTKDSSYKNKSNLHISFFRRRYGWKICGSVDTKHSGSEYFNSKHSFGIVLMAAVDTNFCFIFCDVRTRGRISDDKVFRDTILYENKQFKSTTTVPLPRIEIQLSCFLSLISD